MAAATSTVVAAMSLESTSYPEDSPVMTSSSSSSSSTSSSSSSSSSLPLDVKIIKIIKSCPNYTIRPARLATELSISLDDACEELCALLAAVGGGPDGASFIFEEPPPLSASSAAARTPPISENDRVDGGEDPAAATATATAAGTTAQQQPLPPIMVFTFPPDFEQRAWQYRRREDAQQALVRLVHLGVKFVQILTALGLILSLSIVTVAAMVGFFVAAFLLLSRGSGGGGGGVGVGDGPPRLTLIRQIRWWWSAVRQFLWCYALLGPGDQHNSLMRDIAMDIAMIGTMCNPRNIWFWFRLRHWCERRRQQQQEQLQRGWRRIAPTSSSSSSSSLSLSSQQHVDGTEGVRLLPRDTSAGWTGTPEIQYRGLLSVAVEFLFGPTPFSPGPDEGEKWRLRAAVILDRSLASQGGVGTVALEELVPYVDSPPTSFHDISGVVSSTLPIVLHFHGIPARQGGGENGNQHDEVSNNAKASFHFTELVAETEVVGTTPLLMTRCHYDDDDDDGTLESLFYITEPTTSRGDLTSSTSSLIPSFLQERRYRFTKLQMNQFFLCCCLLIGNLLGVMWLQQSLQPGGLLASRRPTLLFRGFKNMLVPLLLHYAIVFIALPGLRLGVVLVANMFVAKRNQRRSALAAALAAAKSNQDDLRRRRHRSRSPSVQSNMMIH